MYSAQIQLGTTLFEQEIPDSWDKLTPEQFEAVIHIKATGTDRKQQVFEVLLVLFPLTRKHLLALLQMAWHNGQYARCVYFCLLLISFNHRAVWQYFAVEDVIDTLPAIDWVFSKDQTQHTSHVQRINHAGQTYNGPRKLMSGIRWKQLQLADAIVHEFTTNKRPEMLDHLAAVLYIEDGTRFNAKDDSINQRIDLFKDLPPRLKMAIYANYVHLRDTFYQQYDLPKNELDVKGKPDWQSVTLSVAENGSLGPYDSVENADASVVMKYFEKKHKERPKN